MRIRPMMVAFAAALLATVLAMSAAGGDKPALSDVPDTRVVQERTAERFPSTNELLERLRQLATVRASASHPEPARVSSPLVRLLDLRYQLAERARTATR